MSRHSYVFWIFFRQGIIIPSFIIVGYVWQILGRGGAFLVPPHPLAAPKSPSWIGLKALTANSEYPSVIAKNQNLFGVTGKLITFDEKNYQKELTLSPNRAQENPAQVLYKFYQFYLSWRQPHCFYVFLWECISGFVRSYLALVSECIKIHDFRISESVLPFKASALYRKLVIMNF